MALAVDVFSDRWTSLILREAFFGVRRYGQMQRKLGIAGNVLADRLRQLVADAMLERVRYRTDPDWFEYRLTERATSPGSSREPPRRVEATRTRSPHPPFNSYACATCWRPAAIGPVRSQIGRTSTEPNAMFGICDACSRAVSRSGQSTR